MSIRKNMVISPLWLQAAIVTFLLGFAVLGYLAYLIHAEHPPIPKTVLDETGRVIYTYDDVMGGQHLFQKYGLMQYGTIFGHGAYLGPDFTAQYLHHAGQAMLAFHKQRGVAEDEAIATVINESKHNAYDPSADTLVYTPAQTAAFGQMADFYRQYFTTPFEQRGLKRPHISDPADVHRIAAYFSWAAWAASAQRAGEDYSYTNNWPPEPMVGNTPTAQAFLWSVLSLIALLGGAGLMFYAIGRYDLLGWHRADEDDPSRLLDFRPPEDVQLTPAQRAMPWYFLVIAGLFLAQGLLGGVNAHYHVSSETFYGFDLAKFLPYNLSRMWHLQLALFFIASSFLAMGIFIVPMITKHEPKHQDKLAIGLFAALVVVVVGSLLGEAASITDWITREGPWFWLGSQGWEYLDLGRLWQILLVVGMVLWLVILVRGLRKHLPGEHPGNMPYLFLYSALSIPLFYAVGMVFWKDVNFAVMDFWRFWVVHLWVEDFLELFTTIMVAYIYVLLGMVRMTTATRVVYLDILLYSVGGVIGTMHHMYFSGAPAIHMASGAFFSAMEVLPLLLLTFEAWRFMRLGAPGHTGSILTISSEHFPHKWAAMFLIAVGFWNFLGAGVFGFLINLPIVSYYEIGTAFTANHAHGALMGVYGMLAIGFFMFVARYFIRPDRLSDLAMKTSFWGLNIGLALMVLVNLAPIGTIQLYDSFRYGYWHAREPAFGQQTIIQALEWVRFPADTIFILFGILPVVYLALRMFAQRHRLPHPDAQEALDQFTKE